MLAIVAALVLITSWLANWPWLPWLAGGIGAAVLLALLGVPRRLGPAYALALALLVVEVWLLAYVNPWWWVLFVGLAPGRHGPCNGCPPPSVNARSCWSLTPRSRPSVNSTKHTKQPLRASCRDPPAGMVNFHAERIAHPTSAAVAAACFVLGPAAQREFADAYRVPDGPAAIRTLAGQGTDAGDYVNNLWLPRVKPPVPASVARPWSTPVTSTSSR